MASKVHNTLYLKPFPNLPKLLGALKRRGHATVVFVDGIDPALRERFRSPTLRFEDERLDLAQVGRECDLAIANANHGTVSELLLAGRPVLQLTLALEQRMLAEAVRRTGAAEVAPPAGGAAHVERKLDQMLDDPGARFASAARRFAERHAAFDPARERREMVDQLEAVLAHGPRPPRAAVRVMTLIRRAGAMRRHGHRSLPPRNDSAVTAFTPATWPIHRPWQAPTPHRLQPLRQKRSPMSAPG